VAAAGAATALLLAFPLGADAHARITPVLPAPSSTVPGPLRQVLLKYNEPVDQSFFRLTVDAHPVQGQFYFGVRTPATQASLQSDITHVSSRVGSFVTAAILVAVGVLLLGRLLANFNALWCTGYGLIAGGVLVLAAVLGETQLPPLFNGRALPGEAAQSILGVTPSNLGSGCQ
jgi:hypothetical protein